MADTEPTPAVAPAQATPTGDAPWYRYYVLAVLLIAYICNVMDRGVLSVMLQSIKVEFGASDTQLGLLTGLTFALFYSTLGLPIAAWADRSSRSNILAGAVALWSGMTALCGMAVNFTMLLFARAGTAVGEAGGTPPSHSLISDYFALNKRATALSIYALGVPIGTSVGNLIGGWGTELYGWRTTLMLMGAPGLVIALLVRLTIREPPRGFSDKVVGSAAVAKAPPVSEAFRFLWSRKSFVHLSLAAGLHSVVWYGGSNFNAAFLNRSHDMSSGQAGTFLAIIAVCSAVGTFFGGFLADRLGVKTGDRRWYMWVPGYATLIMVPFQFISYLSGDVRMFMPSFIVMMMLAAMFLGPSFATSQAIATVRTRAIATSVVLFVQTLIGLGLGPLLVGMVSDHLEPELGRESLRYGLVIVGMVNLWAAGHYFWGARTLRQDLEATQRATRGGA